MSCVVADDNLQLALALSLSEMPTESSPERNRSTPDNSATESTNSTPNISKDTGEALIDLPPVIVVIDPQRPLKSMGDSGLITFGKQVLRMTYKQHEWYADVDENGVITESGGDGTRYYNPSSFSLAMKKSKNPKIRADSGWNSLTFKGRKL